MKKLRMWAAYRQSSWQDPYDLYSAVRYCKNLFDCLEYDACLKQNTIADDEEIDYFKELENVYMEAGEICDLFLDDEISLECLCYELYRLKLGKYICLLELHLPTQLKERFIHE